MSSWIIPAESPEPQCTDDQCQEPECQYNLQQQQLAAAQEHLQQQELQQQQQQLRQSQHELYQHQLIQPMQTQPHMHQIHYTYSRRTSLDSNALDVSWSTTLFFSLIVSMLFSRKHNSRIDFPYLCWTFSLNFFLFASLQTNQLTDIICRAVQPSIQSATNTLTRNSSLRGDTGDYAIPQPHPHHHIITTTKSTTSLIRCGSCPGSTGVSRRGSSSESSPAGTIGHASVIGGSDGASVIGQGYYTDTTHYDRMPIPIPIVPAPPHHIGSMLSEDEVEPAYATVFPNTTVNMPPPQQQLNYQVEDRNIYRRGARRWRKLYRINGHIFQAKRFNRVSFELQIFTLCGIRPETFIFIAPQLSTRKAKLAKKSVLDEISVLFNRIIN